MADIQVGQAPNRGLAKQRLRDPIIRQACLENYHMAMLCIESAEVSVNALAVICMFRIGDLLFGHAELADYDIDEMVENAHDAFMIPDKAPTIQ